MEGRYGTHARRYKLTALTITKGKREGGGEAKGVTLFFPSKIVDFGCLRVGAEGGGRWGDVTAETFFFLYSNFL